MGHLREDRLRFRRRVKLISLAVAAGFVCLPLGFLGGDTGRVLVTFLGLMSASILPTISLLVGSMSANGRSVKGIDELHKELGEIVSVLWAIFGLVAVSVLALFIGTIELPRLALPVFGTAYAVSVDTLIYRVAQGIVGGASALALSRFGVVPTSFFRALQIRREIAVDEARRRIQESAPTSQDLHSSFPTLSGFGAKKDAQKKVS